MSTDPYPVCPGCEHLEPLQELDVIECAKDALTESEIFFVARANSYSLTIIGDQLHVLVLFTEYDTN